MKEAARSKSLAAEFPRLVIDPNAETRKALLEQWPQKATSFDRFAREKVERGEWERVLKREGQKLVPAYRRSKA